MPTFDWDKWHLGWAAGLPKNEMWAKIRDGKNKSSGEPTFIYDEKSDTSSFNPALGDVVAEHRFVAPAVGGADVQNCFCGWSGEDHADHLLEKVDEFNAPAVVEVVKKKPVKKSDS